MAGSLHHDLPQEIIETILINLPLKSMVRFSCVSKSWQSHVSLQLSARSRKVFALSTYGQNLSRIGRQKSLEILTLSGDTHMYHPVEIVGSCNGLICAIVMRSMATDDFYFARRFKTILWNPATKMFKELPSSFERSGDMLLKRATFVNVKHGFGYDASNDDYKVVESIWISTFLGNKSWLKIYSLNSNSWRFVTRNANPTIGMSGVSGVFVNGSIHWQMLTRSPIAYSNLILGVNLTTETCTVMAAPSGHDSRGDEMLGVSEDCLCLSYCNNDYVDYWMMKEYGVERTWTKIMRVQLGQESPGGMQLMSFKVPEYDEGSGKSLNEWCVEKVCQFDEIPSTIDYVKFQCATYRESLVSVSPPVKVQAPRRETNQIRRLVLPIVFVSLAYCILLLLKYLNYSQS